MDFEQKHQEDLQRLSRFRLLDDDFMTKVPKQREQDTIVLCLMRTLQNQATSMEI